MKAMEIVPQREGVTEAAESEGKAKRVPAGSLLMSFKLTIGRVGFAAVDLFPNEAIVWIKPREGVPVVDRYLALWLSHAELTESAGQAVKGQTLNGASLRAIRVELPPLVVQRRVVDLVNAADAAVSAASAEAEHLERVYRSLLEGVVGSPSPDLQRRRLGDLVERVRRPIHVHPDSTYSQIGIRSHGRGIFHKDPVQGAELGNKKIFEVCPGDLVFNIVFAWEGAVAVAGSEEAGRCGSHRFPTYRATDTNVAELLRYYFAGTEGSRLLDLASPGSAGRNRTLNQAMLLDFHVPSPEAEVTETTVGLLASCEMAVRRAQGAVGAFAAVRQALIGELLSGEREIPESYDDLVGLVA